MTSCLKDITAYFTLIFVLPSAGVIAFGLLRWWRDRVIKQSSIAIANQSQHADPEANALASAAASTRDGALQLQFAIAALFSFSVFPFAMECSTGGTNGNVMIAIASVCILLCITGAILLCMRPQCVSCLIMPLVPSVWIIHRLLLWSVLALWFILYYDFSPFHAAAIRKAYVMYTIGCGLVIALLTNEYCHFLPWGELCQWYAKSGVHRPRLLAVTMVVAILWVLAVVLVLPSYIGEPDIVDTTSLLTFLFGNGAAMITCGVFVLLLPSHVSHVCERERHRRNLTLQWQGESAAAVPLLMSAGTPAYVNSDGSYREEGERDGKREGVRAAGISSLSVFHESIAAVSPLVTCLCAVLCVISWYWLITEFKSTVSVGAVFFILSVSLFVRNGMVQFALSETSSHQLVAASTSDSVIDKPRHERDGASGWRYVVHFLMSWTGLHTLAVVNSLITVVSVSALIAAENLEGSDPLLTYALLGLSSATLVSSSASLLQRRYPRLKVLPSDDSFRVLSLFKTLKILLKALIVSQANSASQVVVFVLIMLSTFLVAAVTSAALLPLTDPAHRHLFREVPRPRAFLIGYVMSYILVPFIVTIICLNVLGGLDFNNAELMRSFLGGVLFLVVYSNNEAARYLAYINAQVSRIDASDVPAAPSSSATTMHLGCSSSVVGLREIETFLLAAPVVVIALVYWSPDDFVPWLFLPLGLMFLARSILYRIALFTAASSSSSTLGNAISYNARGNERFHVARKDEAGNDLRALFERLQIDEKYLLAFIEEEISVSDLTRISAQDLEKLIPKLGPRSRLQEYIEMVRNGHF